MCGIVGYFGNRNPYTVLIKGLTKLEYRGYDSAGVSVLQNGDLSVYREVGKLKELSSLLNDNKINIDDDALSENINLGVGHTRWATHGKPSVANAHPHVVQRIALVHNGIIENYADLKAKLEAEGSVFSSETDTEVVSHLLNKLVSEGETLYTAMEKAIPMLQGSFALVAIDQENPDELVLAKHASPIILGEGEDEWFVASDIPAVLEYLSLIHI